MAGKPERVTARFRIALLLAQAASQHFQHGCIEPEHILLGLYDERDGNAGQILRELGLSRAMIRNVLALEFQEQPEWTSTVPDSSRKALEIAAKLAVNRSLKAVGTGCLLLGILHLNRPVTRRILLQGNISIRDAATYTAEAIQAKKVPFDEVNPGKLIEIADLWLLKLFLKVKPEPLQPSQLPTPDDTIQYYRSVIDVLTEMTQIYPNDANIPFSLARYQYYVQDYSSVLANLDLAQQNNNTTYDVSRLRPLAKYMIKDFEGAIVDCTVNLERRPDDAQMYYMRGWSYHEINQRLQAVADLKKALELWDKIDVLDDADARKQQVMRYLAEEQSS